MDAKKFRRTLMLGRGLLLAPHIERYQRAGKFPPVWNVEIRNDKKFDGNYHPSSDCFSPPSHLYKQMRGLIVPRPITPALRRTFDCGHMWHGYLQAMLVEMGLVTPENVERYITHTIRTKRGQCVGAGTADLVDVAIPGDGSWLVDIKTMNKPEFEMGASAFTFMKWEAQVNCYMDWLGASKAMVLAVCKDSPHEFREYQIVKNPALLDEIYDRWTYTQSCLEAGIEPNDEDYDVAEELLRPGDSVLDTEIAAKAKATDVE